MNPPKSPILLLDKIKNRSQFRREVDKLYTKHTHKHAHELYKIKTLVEMALRGAGAAAGASGTPASVPPIRSGARAECDVGSEMPPMAGSCTLSCRPAPPGTCSRGCSRGDARAWQALRGPGGLGAPPRGRGGPRGVIGGTACGSVTPCDLAPKNHPMLFSVA